MDMPVVAAARLECDVGNVDFLARDQRCQIALASERKSLTFTVIEGEAAIDGLIARRDALLDERFR